MSRLAAGLVALAWSALSGCALPSWLSTPASPGGESADAQVKVELYRGFASAPAEPAARPERLEILIDTTTSMETATAPGPGRYIAARNAAASLVMHTAKESSIGLHALGTAGDDECVPLLRTARSSAGEARDDLVRRIEGLETSGEASLAAAVAGLRATLAQDRNRDRARVVIFSDLGDECGGNLCEEMAGLVSSGSQVDLVVFGGVAVPSCVEKFDITGSWRGADEASPTPFRVEGGDVSGRVARGRADGPPVGVAAGSVQVVVDLQPPLRVDPIELAPGTTARLRIVDFPALDPPVREWSWEIEPARVGAPIEPRDADVR